MNTRTLSTQALRRTSALATLALLTLAQASEARAWDTDTGECAARCWYDSPTAEGRLAYRSRATGREWQTSLGPIEWAWLFDQLHSRCQAAVAEAVCSLSRRLGDGCTVIRVSSFCDDLGYKALPRLPGLPSPVCQSSFTVPCPSGDDASAR